MDKERQGDADDKVFPADRGLVIPPPATGLNPNASGEPSEQPAPDEPKAEDEWHLPDEDREKAIENARRLESLRK
jgi:hypothetical protein